MIASCATGGSRGSAGGEVTGVGATSWAEPTPYGMVLVDRGSMKVGVNKADSLWNLQADARGISVDGFRMDETEITNGKYKQFVFGFATASYASVLPTLHTVVTKISKSRKTAKETL